MKIPGNNRKRASAILLIAVVALCLAAGSVMAAGGGDAEHKGWVATDTYRVMNFTVLAVVLFILLRKPIPKALNARIDGIKEQLADLESQKAEAEKELAQYNQKLASLDEEAEKLVAQYIQQGEDAKSKIIAAAEATAEKLEEQARINIENEFKRAKAGLQEEIIEKALVKAEEILKAKVTDDDQNRLVDEYLEKVVA